MVWRKCVQRATVQIRVERSLGEATRALLPTLLGHLDDTVAILPSTLERQDLVAEAVQSALPAGCQPEIVTPLSGGDARKAMLLPAAFGSWRDVPVETPGTRIDSVMLPDAVMSPSHRIIATDVVEIARHGPFVLDVPARYVHPRQRLRLVTDSERSELMAEVASVVPISLVVVCLMLPEGAFVVATSDVIAAELVALALSERCLGSVRAFTGPWEDPVVQRATELGLGVLVPSAIRLVADGASVHDPWADALLEHVRRRLGIPGTSSLRL
jgi:hypothetical protein